jgi:response regulator RpfG family c-di-GMP phosphodiesterase
MEEGKILIVDDDPVVREVLSDIMMYIGGLKTDFATNGFEGIEKCRENEYDMVLTDLRMPKLSGMDFLKEIKRMDPSLPVVIITGYPTMDTAISAMREGASDFITKPFKIDTVSSVTERLIRERKLIRKITKNGDYEASIGRLNAELFKRLQEIGSLQSLSTELDGVYDNSEIYERIVEMATRLIAVQDASFGIVEDGYLRIRAAIGVNRRDIPIAGSIFEQVIKTKRHYIASFGEVNPHSGTPLTSPFFSIPLSLKNEVFGILSLSNKGDETVFTDDEIHLALMFAKKASLRIENNALYEVFYHNLINTLKSLVKSIEARDHYTGKHSERVTYYSIEIAKVMNLGEEEKEAISFGGYLHDIGKIGVNDEILNKPYPLTEEEFAKIRLHPVIGDNIIKPITFFPKEREIILHHHERLDGKGYPDGLSGEDIPLIARILAVSDTYEAMTSDRPYRKAKTHEYAVEELKHCSNTQFDERVVKAFLQTETGRGKRHA